MPQTDPYFIVRDEIIRSLDTAEKQHAVWRKCAKGTDTEALSKATADLRTSLRSIEWDLEDIQETVNIVENKPQNFKLSGTEIGTRRKFVDDSRLRLQELKHQLSNPSNAASLTSVRPSVKISSQTVTYSGDDPEASVSSTHQQQKLLVRAQDERLETMGDSISVLKGMSRQIGNELEEHSTLLDDMGSEMNRTESRMDTNMKKLSKALNIASDKRQWCVIIVLLVIALILIILLVVL